jgi:hypothetical protein
MFSVEERNRVRDRVLEIASSDFEPQLRELMS